LVTFSGVRVNAKLPANSAEIETIEIISMNEFIVKVNARNGFDLKK